MIVPFGGYLHLVDFCWVIFNVPYMDAMGQDFSIFPLGPSRFFGQMPLPSSFFLPFFPFPKNLANDGNRK